MAPDSAVQCAVKLLPFVGFAYSPVGALEKQSAVKVCSLPYDVLTLFTA